MFADIGVATRMPTPAGSSEILSSVPSAAASLVSALKVGLPRPFSRFAT
jgi:hypothetical protein